MSKYDHQNRDDAFNEAQSVSLDPGQRATLTFRPESRVSDYYVETCAVSKAPNTVYEVLTDGTTEYGEAPIPPTDIDDDSATFRPPETFERELTVVVENVDANTTRTYFVQIIGWERRKLSTEGGF